MYVRKYVHTTTLGKKLFLDNQRTRPERVLIDCGH